MNLIELREAGRPAQIASLGRRMFAESRFARLGFDDDLADTYAQRIVLDPLYIGYGIVDGEELVGMIVGICGATLPFTAAVVSNEHLLFVDPKHRRTGFAQELAHAFIDEAKRRGALDITFTDGAGVKPELVGKLFESCGLPRVGGVHVMEV